MNINPYEAPAAASFDDLLPGTLVLGPHLEPAVKAFNQRNFVASMIFLAAGIAPWFVFIAAKTASPLPPLVAPHWWYVLPTSCILASLGLLQHRGNYPAMCVNAFLGLIAVIAMSGATFQALVHGGLDGILIVGIVSWLLFWFVVFLIPVWMAVEASRWRALGIDPSQLRTALFEKPSVLP